MAKDQDKKKELFEEEENTSKTASEEKDAENIDAENAENAEETDASDRSEEKTDVKDSDEEASEEKVSEEKDSEEKDSEETDEEDPSETKKKNITPEATFDSPNGKSVHRPIVYLELALAIIALVFIIVAIVNYRKSHTEPAAPGVSGTDAAAVTTGVPTSALPDGAQAAEIDNSKVAEMKPATPDIAAMNKLTEAECEANVADGTMIRMDCADGTYVYVRNFKDQEYLASHLVVTEADIDKMIKEEFLDVEKVPLPCDHEVAELGDIANIDYEGKKDGVAFAGGTASGYDLSLGSGTFIPGFEDGVVGMKIGETKDIPLTFPENYQSEELAGKDVIFTVTLNALKSEGYATELTDDIANYLSGGMCPTVQEMRDYLKSNWLIVKKMEEFLMHDLYVGGVSSANVDEYYNLQVQQIMDMGEMYGMSMESLLSAQGYTLEDALNQIMSEASSSVRADVLYRAILEHELQPVTDDDLTTLATQNGYGESVDEFIEQNGRDALILYLQRDKATAYLQELADKASMAAPASTEDTDAAADATESDNAAEPETAEEVPEKQ
ncbi:MAG: FKBP-type peptidyl-prolyl cis-trans isomerase [Lachnospiraceae bacterium]|nr:FKBP-type peptidyl-prolyl cis-trans isomerase [Lachnospiraceae bacterium]